MINEEKVALFVAGANGSGKSTLINALRNSDIMASFLHINPDIIVREQGFPETKEGYIKAFEIAEGRFEKAIEKGRNILRETVLSSDRKIEDIKALQDAGYQVNLIYMSTGDVYTNVMNVTKRVIEGGHSAPIEKIVERFDKSHKNLAKIANQMDCVVLIDNPTSFEDPVVHTGLVCGEVCFEIEDNHPEWISSLVSELERNFYNDDKAKLCRYLQEQISNNFLEIASSPVEYINLTNDT